MFMIYECLNCYFEYSLSLINPICDSCSFCYYCREFVCFHNDKASNADIQTSKMHSAIFKSKKNKWQNIQRHKIKLQVPCKNTSAYHEMFVNKTAFCRPFSSWWKDNRAKEIEYFIPRRISNSCLKKYRYRILWKTRYE